MRGALPILLLALGLMGQAKVGTIGPAVQTIACGGSCLTTGGGVVTTTTTTTTTSTTTTTIIVTMAGLSDVNCPSTLVTQNNPQGSLTGYAAQGQTCPTGSRAGGYDVVSIRIYVAVAAAGQHLMCSVYDSSSPKNKVNAGCDTPSTVLSANPNGYVTVTPPGPCHLAVTTRYWVACLTDDNTLTYGTNSTTCTGCLAWVAQTFGTFPATLAAGGSYNSTPAYYLTVR